MDKAGTGESVSEYANVIYNLPLNLKINLFCVINLLATRCFFFKHLLSHRKKAIK